MNITFKTHFPWPGADGNPEPTHFPDQIINELVLRDGAPRAERSYKLHTIRRVKDKPRFREGMKLVLQTGSRFKPVPFVETACTGVQTLWMEARPNLGGVNLLIWVRDPEPGPARLLTAEQVSALAQNDGLLPYHFVRWFTLDLLHNGLEGTYQVIHWTEVRY
jgi:hypothetical protein